MSFCPFRLVIVLLGLLRFTASGYSFSPQQRWQLQKAGKKNLDLLVFMIFNIAFNISAISWRSVFRWRRSGVPGKTVDLPKVTDKLVSRRSRHSLVLNQTYDISSDIASVNVTTENRGRTFQKQDLWILTR